MFEKPGLLRHKEAGVLELRTKKPEGMPFLHP
jgi:hypothetical protein